MKIICIGRNYAQHAAELGNEIPDEPVIFMKPPSALLVNDKPFFHPDFSEEVHHEIEVVLKVGKNGKAVQPEFAHRYFSELTLGIDFTARDLQSRQKAKGLPWEIAKGFDGSAVLGEFVSMEGMDPKNLQFRLEKNGETVQSGDTSLLLFPFEEIIVQVSKYFKLQMGDLIYTGTPAGVGPVQPGDELRGFLTTPNGERELFYCAVK